MNNLKNLDALIDFTESELKKALEEYKKINKSNIKEKIVIMDEIIKYETSLKKYYNQKKKEN